MLCWVLPALRAQIVKLARDIEENQVAAAWRRFEAVPQSLRDTARKRLAALQAVEQLLAAGQPLLAARATVAAQWAKAGIRGYSVASLGRWAAMVAHVEVQHRLALLVPGYIGRTATADMPPEAWDMFKADYLRVEAPTATGCYERLQRRAHVEGWALPSLTAFTRRLRREIPLPVLKLAREGSDALGRLFPAQERDHSVFNAMQAVNADGHRFDVFVRFPAGQIARPVMVAVQDLYSGKLLSWRIGETESADLARLAFRDTVERYGIMSDAWLDNGRGFASKLLTGGTARRFRFKVREEEPTGMLVALGVNIHWTTPYHGQAKPIERAWRDLCDRVAKHPAFAGAYTGNRPGAKPENYGSKAVPLDIFTRVVAEEIAAHNARLGRRSAVCGGSSFNAVFSESYERSTIRRASKAQLREFLLAAEHVMASPRDGSVRLAGNRYWCEALAQHNGQKLLIRFDPDALHDGVAVYRANGAFIGTADCLAAVGFADTQAAREHAKAKKHFRRAAKEQLGAERRMNIAEVAARLPRLPTEILPIANVIAPIFGKPSRGRVQQREPAGDARERRFQDFMDRVQRQSSAQAAFDPDDAP